MAGMQVIYQTKRTYKEYHQRKLWQKATLKQCPLHSDGHCRLERHGTYERSAPDGKSQTRIARYLCRRAEGSVTISLLPSFFAAQHTGTLDQFEDQVAAAEKQGIWQASKQLRPSLAHDPGHAYRWLKRRVEILHATLKGARDRLIQMSPDGFTGGEFTVRALRKAFRKRRLLRHRRLTRRGDLQKLLSPLGFASAE